MKTKMEYSFVNSTTSSQNPAETISHRSKMSSGAYELEQSEETAVLSVSICGSYHSHLKEMRKLIIECRKLGIFVRIPKYAQKKFSKRGFVYLKGEKGTPKDLQDKNFRAISHSSFLMVVNPKGYVGSSTSMEIGYAIAKEIPIFCTDKPKDYVFQFYAQYGKPLTEIKKILLSS